MNLFCNCDCLHICIINPCSRGQCASVHPPTLMLFVSVSQPLIPQVSVLCVSVCVSHIVCSVYRLFVLLSFSLCISNSISQIINNKQEPFFSILPLFFTTVSSTTGLQMTRVWLKVIQCSGLNGSLMFTMTNSKSHKLT